MEIGTLTPPEVESKHFRLAPVDCCGGGGGGEMERDEAHGELVGDSEMLEMEIVDESEVLVALDATN